jgi:hypothetical protein
MIRPKRKKRYIHIHKFWMHSMAGEQGYKWSLINGWRESDTMTMMCDSNCGSNYNHRSYCMDV